MAHSAQPLARAIPHSVTVPKTVFSKASTTSPTVFAALHSIDESLEIIFLTYFIPTDYGFDRNVHQSDRTVLAATLYYLSTEAGATTPSKP